MFKGLFQTKKNTPKAEIVWDLTDIDLNNIPKHIAIITFFLFMFLIVSG